MATAFDYDETVNIYDAYADYLLRGNADSLQKLPQFYRDCLENPRNLRNILKSGLTSKLTYKGANMFTLMACAVFHLCKLIVMREKYEKKETTDCALIIEIYNDWIDKIFEQDNQSIDVSQHIDGFFTPYTYMMLLSFATYKSQDNPIYRYLYALYRNSRVYAGKFKINVLEEIIKPLFDDHHKDLYNFDVKAIYVMEDGQKLLLNYDSIVNANYYTSDEYGCIFNYMSSEYFEYPSNIHRYIPQKDLKMQLLINKWIVDYLYDINANDQTIINNEKWQTVLKLMWDLFENSDDLYYDIRFLTANLFTEKVNISELKPQLFIRQDVHENILYPIIRNRHYDDNYVFVKDLFEAIFNQTFENITDDQYVSLMIHKVGPFFKNKEGQSILMAIFKTHFQKSNDINDVADAHSLSYSSPLFAYDSGRSNSSSNSSNSNGSNSSINDNKKKKKQFKFIVDALIKNGIKTFHFNALQLFNKDKDHYTDEQKQQYSQDMKIFKANIFAYKDSLAAIGIKLDNYDFHKIVTDSPYTNKSKRSVDKKLSKEFTDKEMNASKFQKFTNQQLMKKLTKIYVRTVQGDCEISNYDRIVKIRNYLKSKYKKTIDYRTDYVRNPNNHKVLLTKGKELLNLLNYWDIKLKRGDLNVPYVFKYANEPGVDQSGLTKQTFDNIAKQLQELNLFILLPDSENYILNPQLQPDNARFVGQLLAILILNDAYLSFNISIVYLAHMMFRKKDLSDEELFLYFLLDLNSKINANYMEMCEAEDDSSCDPVYTVNNVMKPRYHIGTPSFQAFLDGFFLSGKNNKLFYNTFKDIGDKIRIYDLDKMLTNFKLNKKVFRNYIFNNIEMIFKHKDSKGEIVIESIAKTDAKAKIYTYLESLFLEDGKESFAKMYEAYPDSEVADPVVLAKKKLFNDKQSFWRGILKYWTGTRGVISTGGYKVTINDTIGYMMSNTCHNHIQLPVESQRIKSKQDLYNEFMTMFITDQNEVFTLA